MCGGVVGGVFWCFFLGCVAFVLVCSVVVLFLILRLCFKAGLYVYSVYRIALFQTLYNS